MATKTSTKKVRPEPVSMVKIDDMRVDETYQRSIKMNLVQEIANEWDWNACGMILIARRKSGLLYIVDGQHRVAAAKLLGLVELPARIVASSSSKEEAKWRIRTNRKRNETSVERFKAEVIAEERHAVSILSILRSFKATVGLETGHYSAEDVNAIAALEKVWHHDQGATLRQVLALLHEAFGELNSHTTGTQVILAVDWFVRTHDQFDRKQLTKVLKERQAATKARASVLNAEVGGALFINHYRALIEFYNEGMAKAAQLKPMTKGYKSTKRLSEDS